MQNYNQQAQGYQRPGSTAAFAGQPGGPPQYGAAPQSFQSPAPAIQSQWAPPTQNTAPVQQQWNQSPPQQNWSAPPPVQQQAPSSYNPGTYGAMPGAFSQGQTANAPGSSASQGMNPSYPSQYQPQQQDTPPPPPPKPTQGFGAAIQQQQQQQNPQSWSQQSSFGTQQTPQSFQSTPQSTSFTPQGQQGEFNTQGQQGGFQQAQQATFQNQQAQQQQYSNAAPPPPSQTPGGSYFPPAQGRPTSLYGADQASQFSSSPTTTSAQSPPNNIMSPNEQHPAYIPPSLSGQGVQSYMPTNTNPMPGVYVPPPPDIPAWQQAQHAPLQPGRSKFKYTKPIVHPEFQTQAPQGFQGGMGMQQPMQQPIQQPLQQQIQQPMQPPMQQQTQQSMQPQTQFSQQQQPQVQQVQQPFGQPIQNQFQPQAQIQPLGQFGQPMQAQQTQQQFSQMQQGNQPQQPMQQFQAQGGGDQWNTSPPANQGYGQQQQQNVSAPYGMQQPMNQQGWQSGQPAQGSIPPQNYGQGGQEQVIQAPKPINGQSQTTPPSFVSAAEPSPQSQPASPISQRQSMSFGSGQNASALGRTSSVSSIALGTLGRQQTFNDRTGSVPPKAPSPPSAPVAASALGAGGPSDWEHFGMIDEEIDDEELFSAKKEGTTDQPQMLDSVELPVHPSPPSAHEWPTPPVQATAALNISPQRNDTFAPTPPLKPATVSTAASTEQLTSQKFVMDDSIVVSQSPQPTQSSQLPPAQSAFVMDSGGWDLPKQLSPAQQLNAPPANNTFVVGDGGWSQASNVPNITPIKTDQPSSGFVMDDGGWGGAEQTPTQRTGGGIPLTQGLDHTAELKAKDEAYGQLQSDTEREKAELRAQLQDAQAETEAARSRAETDMKDWIQQIEQLKADVEKIKSDTSTQDSNLKEKSVTIEILKEDIEGKEKVIAEQNATIQDVRKQLRDIPPPKASDLIPDLDPWYASSLERFIAMLRQEANEPAVEDKIKTFTGFLAAESHARGLEYPTAPPVASISVSPAVHPQSTIDDHSAAVSRVSSTKSFRNQDIHVVVPTQPTPVEDAEYSPGGRPLVRRRQTLKSDESIPTEQSFVVSSGPIDERSNVDFQQGLPHAIRTSIESVPPRSGSTTSFNVRGSVGGIASEPSTHSTAILTPTSSTGDDFGKVIQSPPEQPTEPPKPQYQPYVPGNPGKLDHRQSMSFGTPSFQTGKSNKHDEIFFGEVQSQPTSKPSSRPTTSASNVPDMPIPAPLSLKTTPAITKRSEPTLADILPSQIVPSQSHPRLETLHKQALVLPADFTYITTLTQNWEKSAASTRAKNDRERQRRQEESETRATQLFDDNEISYADIGAMEDEFKEQEREKKEYEDRAEYKSYVEAVFDKVYDGLQDEIKTLMEIFVEVEGLLAESVCGKEAHEAADPDRPTTLQCMEFLRELHDLVEIRHDKVVQAVADRDKRYKKTEIQPLYAAGNIAKMKSVERHFENAEKQAVVRAKGEKADRVGNIVRICEEAVVRAVGVEQAICDKILAGMKSFSPSDDDEDHHAILTKAKDTFCAIKASSKSLLTLFNALEIIFNFSVLDAEIAQARAEGGDVARIKEFETEMRNGEKRLREEFERRVMVLDRDVEEVRALVGESAGAAGGDSEEEMREKRLRAALEEAKRRNGEI